MVTFLSHPLSCTVAAMPMDLSEMLAVMGNEASKPRRTF